jgi:predicted dehydrogenase
LGGGLQTCRQLIDEGAIGIPLAASAFMTCPGHESWHPNPAFYYQPGAGPMFDMGPYYLTALVSLLGSVRRVTGQARASFPTRTITSQPKYGEKIIVNTPTHVTGLLEFENGVQGTIITSFDVWAANLPFIEIYGSMGSLSLPDPNTFGGVVKLFHKNEKIWQEVPITRGYTENSRGLGVADMAHGIQTKQPHRANGDLALHVLEVMHGFLESSNLGQHIIINSRCDRPAPLQTDMIGAT